MNLLTDKWIPVRKASGKATIAVSDLINKNILDLDFPRPDFNASIKNFLIGLLQTVMAPKTEADWSKTLHNRPSSEYLEKVFKPLLKNFNLFDPINGSLFMQDTSLPKKHNTWPIQSMFLDGPRIKTINDGKDFFKKDGELSNICPSCSAALLYTLQTMAWTGGKGYYTSIRYAGKSNILTMLAEGEDLWETLWLNVLPKSEMKKYGTYGKVIFPWTSKFRPTAKQSNSDPCHVYWEKPWRVKLISENKPLLCDCCGQKTSIISTAVEVVGPGTQHEKSMKHPLSPYKEKSPLYAGEFCSKYPTIGAILTEDKGYTMPYAIKNRDYKSIDIYGASMDGAKYRFWIEKRIPHISIDKDIFAWMIKIQSVIAKALYSSCNRCWSGEAPSPSYGYIDEHLDSSFYTIVSDPNVKQIWFNNLYTTAFNLFDVESTKSSRIGLVRYIRNELAEQIEGMAKKEELTFIRPPLPKSLLFSSEDSNRYEISKDFMSDLMRWFNSLQYQMDLKTKLANLTDMEEINDQDLCEELVNYFVSNHRKEDETILDEEILKKVAIASVVLSNLKDSVNTTFYQYCQSKSFIKNKLSNVNNILNDWPVLRDVVRDAGRLNVISVFRTIINWE